MVSRIVCVCVCVCMCVCMGVLVDFLAQGLSLTPTWEFFIWFFSSSASYQSTAVIGWVPGICWGANQVLFSCNGNGPGGTSGAHTTGYGERPYS